MQKKIILGLASLLVVAFLGADRAEAATVYIIGGANNNTPALNDVWQTTDMVNWTNSTAPFTPRYTHAGVVYMGNLAIVGGSTPGQSIHNDIWRSINGMTWLQLLPTTNLPAIWEHAMANFAGKMWILSGSLSSGLTNQIRTSTNGTVWANEPNAPWTARLGHTATVFNNKLYIIGGSASDGVQTKDVWSLSSEMVWHKDVENIQAASRTRHTTIVFKKKLWVLGGASTLGLGFLNDVWSTSDGATWTQQAIAPWSARLNLGSVVLNGKLYIMGGTDAYGTVKNDIWSTTDGTTWIEETANAPWPERTDFVVLKK